MMVELNISSFLGRFHPVLVHLPIGILLLAFIFKLLSFTNRYKRLKSVVRPSLFYGMMSAVAASVSGYYLSLEGGYDDNLITQHKWMGFATAALAFIVYLFSLKVSFILKRDRKIATTILFFPLIILLTWTGHLGGSITHGEGFLFESSQKFANDESKSKRISPTNVEEAQVFGDVIKPLLEEKCYACHSSRKQKGQLRLDEIEFIRKGGKYGELLVAGDPNQSELFKRVSLSIEEKGHMPPGKEPQLTSVETELIRWWIAEGASFDKRAKEFLQRNELTDYLKSLDESTQEQWIPEKEVEAADPAITEKLRSSGVAVVPMQANSNYLSVSFAGKRNVTQEDVDLLKKLNQQVIELKLFWTSVSDDQLAMLSELKELRRLQLDHTQITDKGIRNLKPLKNLYYLNLVETKVSDDAVNDLNDMKGMKQLFVFHSGITKSGLAKLNSQVKVDSGNYQLPFLPTDTLVVRKK